MARGEQRSDQLATYRSMRRFEETPEPKGKARRQRGGDLYTIQKHAARRLHYDLRLELDGVLKSWAVTKGPSLDPATKRLAVRTEDHPLEYAMFEGRIPEGNYGAGTVLLWDRGAWEPVGDPHEGLEKGKLVFTLQGERLRGRWALVRFKGNERSKRENWLLIKEKDEEVDREADPTAEFQTSVASGRAMEEISDAPEAVWEEGGERKTAKPRRKGKPKPLPEFVAPQLATLVDEAPDSRNWLFEVKFDGYRALAAVSNGEVRIYTRNGLDWTDRYPPIARALAGFDLDGVLLDGEIVVVDDKGRSDFGSLQEALKTDKQRLSFFVFDLLAEAGKSLRDKPLMERKSRLEALLADAGRKGPVYYSDHIEGSGQAMLDALCGRGFEGIIAKRADAPYRSGRTRSWLKVKCGNEQEFVIAGWSPSTRDRPFASIILGLHEGDELRYAGKVGTGFSERDLADLSKRFRKLARKSPPLEGVPKTVARTANWVRPDLVAHVEFAEFTREGLVRQGRFIGLREDKPARMVVRERPKPIEVSQRGTGGEDVDVIGGVRLSHPDKVLYPQHGITKRDLASYLELVSERMMPYVADRLVSFVRCPDGSAKECFFQRHGAAGMSEAIKRMSVPRKSGKNEEYLYIRDAEGLIAAAQMGVLEFHIWGSRIDDVQKPERVVFDLDPDPSVDFAAVKDAAVQVRDALAALNLRSFPLLTGGKGIHVVVPIIRRHEWPTVKAFAKGLADHFAQGDPERYVATMTKARRKGRIFIDHFRNDRTATAIAPYSPRAHAAASIAWPVSWRELEGIGSAGEVTFRTVKERLVKPDPWEGYSSIRQGLKDSAFRALGVSAK